MSQKTAIFWGMLMGSAIGGYIPSLWGGSLFSFSSIFFSAAGAMVGIWLGYRLGD